MAALPGDANLNGIVNFEDFVLVANNFGMTGTCWGQDNFNLDNITNFQDFAILSNNFLQMMPSDGAVPEPTALSLVWFGTLAWVMRRDCGSF